jgi:ERCC4-type nuclease
METYTAKEIAERVFEVRENPDLLHGDFVVFDSKEIAKRRVEQLKKYGINSHRKGFRIIIEL